MRTRSTRRLAAVFAAAALVIAGCQGDQDPADGEEATELDQQSLDEILGDLEDPNEDVVDGVFRGSGVVLPVPDGWQVDQLAYAQGFVAAVADETSQQMSAQAIDVSDLDTEEQLDLDTIIDGVRQQIPAEPDVDEPIELAGAERAHRLTYLDVESQQEGQPASSATIVVADDGEGRLGQFTFDATTDEYDEDLEETFLETAGFDPDSEPRPLPQPPPADGEAGGEGSAG